MQPNREPEHYGNKVVLTLPAERVCLVKLLERRKGLGVRTFASHPQDEESRAGRDERWGSSGGHVGAFGFVAEGGEEGERDGDEKDSAAEDGGVVAEALGETSLEDAVP